jgi:hypothetical protein
MSGKERVNVLTAQNSVGQSIVGTCSGGRAGPTRCCCALEPVRKVSRQ